MLMAVFSAINSFGSLLNLDLYFLRWVGGSSILPLLFIYLAADVFQYCKYHKSFIWYIIVMESLNIIDYTLGIPLDFVSKLAILSIVTVSFLFIILYQHVANNKETSSRTD